MKSWLMRVTSASDGASVAGGLTGVVAHAATITRHATRLMQTVPELIRAYSPESLERVEVRIGAAVEPAHRIEKAPVTIRGDHDEEWLGVALGEPGAPHLTATPVERHQFDVDVL